MRSKRRYVVIKSFNFQFVANFRVSELKIDPFIPSSFVTYPPKLLHWYIDNQIVRP